LGRRYPGGVSTTATGDDNATAPDPTQQVGYIDLVKPEHSVNPLYRKGAIFMFHDHTLKYLKTLKDKYGRPLWESGFADRILGYPYAINNDMDSVVQTSPISARETVLFGNLQKYVIRRVRNLSVLRLLVERFADYGVVGFLGFARYDGGTVDAGTHPIRYLLNSAS
jgi:HK97 family phage major capsid protein